MSEKTKKEPITYSRYGDYLIPNLILDNGKVRPKIGRYGRLRLKFNGRYTDRLFIRSRC